MGFVFKVCIPYTNRDFFDYLASEQAPCIGARVWVPFRQGKRIGLVIGKGLPDHARIKIKSIESVIDEAPLLSEEILSLCQWVSRYYQSPLSEVIPLAVPKKYREGKPCSLPTSHYFYLKTSVEQAHRVLSARATRQHALVDFLASQHTFLSKKMIVQAGFTTNQLLALQAAGLLDVMEQIDAPSFPINPKNKPHSLNEEQETAVKTIGANLASYHCFLLQGVTGSGKTEVYFHIISQVLAAGRQVLILVPEIGLTPQLLSRFSSRFHEPMVVIHSHLSDGERQTAWQLARTQKARLVIGTRTAVFTPLPALGLIVIDEEHDTSLKQMDGVRYSGRDTALMRAHAANIPIILGSATPSLESLYNCTRHKYHLLQLTQKAMTDHPLQFQIMDIRNQPLQHGIATPTLKIINTHLQQQNQVLVFINRRGFAPVLLCHLCGWIAGCRACDSHLTLHRQRNKLLCHHCGLAQNIPPQCPACDSKELLPIGTGTQRVYDYLSSQFPSTCILRIDRDEVGRKKALEKGLESISTGKVQLVIGTQMLAKGHHFPRLTLVVILDADNGFYNQDFRALERLGQLLTQVAGRAGRAERQGQVVIQTHLPQHPLLNVLIQQGYETFAQALLQQRQQAELPPFHFIAIIRAQGKVLAKLLQFLNNLREQLQQSNITTLGPAPAPLPRKANQYRMQLLLKSPCRSTLQIALTQIRHWLTMNNISRGIRWNIDVDPMDLS
ncbi:primosomal protein N' [Legionella nagasakiensis]|uniref:primosomal protein N' n=1 Tax=Legionella nagasakiensis TaxID=535290 RepID=UPI001056AF5C|nr:primosomal protein N' [Legionella nagasakiensis]